jgi:hypothetical protein
MAADVAADASTVARARPAPEAAPLPHRAAFLPAAFLLYLALALAQAAPTLRWPMVYDDLHLVRTYTAAEIAGSFHGRWDPDGIETPGYRPLSLVFNHARAAAFGENVTAHRIFLVALLAAYLALLVRIAVRLGLGPVPALVAGALVLCARYTTYHYVWITDGNHLVQGVGFAGALLLLLGGLRHGAAAVPLIASAALFVLALLLREDTLAALPPLLLISLVEARRGGSRLRWAAYALAVASLSAAYLAGRAAAVPDAPPPGLDFGGFVRSVQRALSLVGPEGFETLTRIAAIVGAFAPVLAVLALAAFRRRLAWRGPLLWLGCAVVACAPALTVTRDNLLLFPVTFAALFYAAGFAELARLGPWVRGAAGLVLAILLVGGAAVSRAFGENFHPMSARVLWWNAKFVYGTYSERATIPEERLRAVRRQLASVGIRSEPQMFRMRALVAEAIAAGRRRPGPAEVVFFPLLPEDDF